MSNLLKEKENLLDLVMERSKLVQVRERERESPAVWNAHSDSVLQEKQNEIVSVSSKLKSTEEAMKKMKKKFE